MCMYFHAIVTDRTEVHIEWKYTHLTISPPIGGGLDNPLQQIYTSDKIAPYRGGGWNADEVQMRGAAKFAVTGDCPPPPSYQSNQPE